MKRILGGRGRFAVLMVVIATLAPLEYSAAGGVRISVAACMDGTCCGEPKSDCIINNILVENAYRKSEGKCPQLLPEIPG